MRVGGLENAGGLWLGLGDGCKTAGWCGLVTMASTMAGPSGCLAAILGGCCLNNSVNRNYVSFILVFGFCIFLNIMKKKVPLWWVGNNPFCCFRFSIA